jgi:hypothetical protein
MHGENMGKYKSHIRKSHEFKNNDNILKMQGNSAIQEYQI